MCCIIYTGGKVMDCEKIGQFIVKERKNKNLSQNQLADMLFVSYKTVSKWENGRGLPDTSVLPKLCEILDVSINELLSGERLTQQQYNAQAEYNMSQLLEHSHLDYSTKTRKTVYYVTTAIQAILATLAITFMMLFLSMNGPNYAPTLAIIFTIALVVTYIVQLVLVSVMYRNTSQKLRIDRLFLYISINLLPLAVIVYAILISFGM